MRHPRPIILVAALALPACSGAPDQDAALPDDTSNAPAPIMTPEEPSSDNPSSDQPSFEDGMSYHFKQDQGGAALSYGVPDTDNIALSLRCPRKGPEGSILIAFNRPARIVAERPGTLVAASGDARQELSIETRSTQLGTNIEVRTSADSAPLVAYRGGAPLEIRYGDEAIRIPAADEQGQIARFFEACG